MNPLEALARLIADLYVQITALNAEVAELRAQLGQSQEAAVQKPED